MSKGPTEKESTAADNRAFAELMQGMTKGFGLLEFLSKDFIKGEVVISHNAERRLDIMLKTLQTAATQSRTEVVRNAVYGIIDTTIDTILQNKAVSPKSIEILLQITQ